MALLAVLDKNWTTEAGRMAKETCSKNDVLKWYVKAYTDWSDAILLVDDIEKRLKEAQNK